MVKFHSIYDTVLSGSLQKSQFFYIKYKVWVCKPAYKSIYIILYFLTTVIDIITLQCL